MGFDRMFGFMSIAFPVVFLLVIGVFVLVIAQGIIQWSKNNASPLLTVPAVVVAKRQAYRHHSGRDGLHGSGFTRYYATFEVESGDRIELPLSGQEYGLLVERDAGMLTFQGTRYHGFSRSPVR